jgi:hypothetical protein
MAIKKTSVTLDGLKHNLDDRDRVGAQALLETTDAVTFEGKAKFDGNSGLSAGSGFSDAATYKSWTEHLGGAIVKTSVYIDLTGIRSTQANDVIGNDGAASANIGQYTTAVMGTLNGVVMTCLETPTGGDPDINLAFADEATLAEDGALSGGTNSGTILNNGDIAAGTSYAAGNAGLPAADQYLYLVAGAATDADYTAGVILIEFYGTA